jgi:hypothetical protein
MTKASVHRLSLTLTVMVALTASAIPACAQGPASVIPQSREGAWMELHNSFRVLAKKGHIDLLFLGDSITQMWNENNIWQRYYGPRRAANSAAIAPKTSSGGSSMVSSTALNRRSWCS